MTGDLLTVVLWSLTVSARAAAFCLQYSVFTLFMIFTFEASVVMQRIKNLNTLKGMDNKEIEVYVYRQSRSESLG